MSAEEETPTPTPSAREEQHDNDNGLYWINSFDTSADDDILDVVT